MDRRTLVVNLFGGPGSGKSTMAAGLFADLKRRGRSCELVTEYVKGKVWEGSLPILDDQIYIFAKQYHQLWALNGKVDIIVCDGPLLASSYYGARLCREFHDLVECQHESFWNLNILVGRGSDYDPDGRTQNFDESLKIDAWFSVHISNHFKIDQSRGDSLLYLVEKTRYECENSKTTV